MKTVTAKSADGKRKMRVPIVAENGPFSVARGVNLKKGHRAMEKFWRVYLTKIGVGFTGFRLKASAIKAMNAMTKIKGNWDRPYEQLAKDTRLAKRYAEVIAQVKVECGDWIKVS